MTRVLIIVGDQSLPQRVVQIAGLYSADRNVVDMIVTSSSTTDQLAFQPARLGVTSEHSGAVDVARAMHADSPISILHRIGDVDPQLRWAGLDGVTQISEVSSPQHLLLSAGERTDLVLAACESQRRSLGDAGLTCMRLPLQLPEPTLLRLAPGRRIGWWGEWDATLCAAWADLIEAFVDAHICPDMQILLLGPGVENAALPPCLNVARRPTVAKSSLRALDLAILPAPATGRDDEIASILAHGVPLLALEDSVAAFEDRWHLPTASDLSGLARLVDASLPGQQGVTEPTTAALTSTVSAIRRDVSVMETYVMAEIRRIAG
ncbi:MAG: hypothetical protein AAF501_17080 [Pseudomonadota bacterium]